MMLVDSHPEGLLLTDSETPRCRRSTRGLGRLLATVVVLVVAAVSAGLLAMVE